MSFTVAEGRQEILDRLAGAIAMLATAVATLSVAAAQPASLAVSLDAD